MNRVVLKKEMRIKGKKLIHYTSRKTSHIRNDISPKNKSSFRVSFNQSRRCNFKLQSQRSKEGKSKRIMNGTETLQKSSDRLSAKSPSSSKFLDKKTSCFGHRRCRKNESRNGAIIKKVKRGKLRRKKRNVGHDEAGRLLSRAKYLLIKMKMEQNLIDAYSGDGWKGQSREKIKPEKELQRAEKQILKYKLGIRDAIRQLAVLSSEGSIQDSVIYSDGSVFHEHIFCAKCKAREAFPDNDIILCDGTCNRGFHQKCLEPPLVKIPPEDQGWLCKFCDCKMEILEAINAHLDTCFTVNSNWEDVFKEATSSPDAVFFPPAEEWPSEDSEDEDYFPERNENSSSRTGIIEDTTFDDASTSSSLFCSSEEERSHLNRAELHSSDGGSENHVRHKIKIDCASSVINIDSVEASNREITSYKRQRRDVDYKRLHDEMFGKQPTENEPQTEDEDWGPRRKKQKKTESDAVTTLVDCRDEDGCSNVVSNEKSSRNRRWHFRIPSNAVEKLRQVFSENELPSRTVKEHLSQQLGISSDKITRWFKNARYAALKTRKEEFTEQSHINNITKGSTTSTRNQISSKVTSMDDPCLLPLSSIIHVPRNWKRILRRKAATHLSTPLSKQHKAAANALLSDKGQKHNTLLTEKQVPSFSVKRNLSRDPGLTYHQVNTCFTNAMHLKRQEYYTRKKISSEKALKTKESSISQKDGMTYHEQLCLLEIERLCCLEDRIQKLKKTLLESQDNDRVSVRIHSREERVIYVPVAEVKEKE